MKDKLKRLYWITGYRWGLVPFCYYDRKDKFTPVPDSLERFEGWACVREDIIKAYLLRELYLYLTREESDKYNFDDYWKLSFPRNRNNRAFEDVSPEGAVDFALKTLDPDGKAPRVVPHYLGVGGAVNSQTQVLYFIHVKKENLKTLVYAQAEDNSAIIIWKDWHDPVNDIDLKGFNEFLTNASLEELKQKAGILRPCPYF